jgi:hypothetical protein
LAAKRRKRRKKGRRVFASFVPFCGHCLGRGSAGDRFEIADSQFPISDHQPPTSATCPAIGTSAPGATDNLKSAIENLKFGASAVACLPAGLRTPVAVLDMSAIADRLGGLAPVTHL